MITTSIGITVPIVQTRKLRLRDIKQLAHNHTECEARSG